MKGPIAAVKGSAVSRASERNSFSGSVGSIDRVAAGGVSSAESSGKVMALPPKAEKMLGTTARNGTLAPGSSPATKRLSASSDHLRAKLRAEEANKAHKKKNETFLLTLTLPDGIICEEITPTTTGGDAIEQVVFAARECSEWAREQDILADQFMLKVEGLDYFITQHHLALHRVRVLQICMKTFVVPRLQLVPKTPELEEMASNQEATHKQLEVAEIDMQSDLAAMISGLTEYLQLENDDITAYRAAMTIERALFTSELSKQMAEEETYMLHKYVDSEPLPLKLPISINVGINLPLQEKSLRTLGASPTMTVNELIVLAFRKFQSFSPEASAGKEPSEYILKVTGFQDFLFGEDQLIYYDYIRRCISKEQDIVLSLVERAKIVAQYPQERVDIVSIVDKILAVPRVDDTSMKVVSVQKKTVGLKLKLKRVEGLTEQALSGNVDFFAAMTFINGCLPLSPPQFTKLSVAQGNSAIWDQVIFSSIIIPNIPLGTRLQLAVYARKRGKDGVGQDPKSVESATDTCVGWVNIALFNSAGFMKSGLKAAILWTGDGKKECRPDPVAPCLQNLFAKDPTTIFIDFEPSVYYKNPKIRPRMTQPPMPSLERMPADLQNRLEQLVKRDSLAHLTPEEKKLLWEHRASLLKDPRALPRVALSCPWDDDKCVRELYELVRFWAKLEASQAVELIGSQFSDPVLRSHGAAALNALSDAQILQFLPQLVQGLKFELNHESALATMLIQRAFRNRHRIGHAFFWQLKGEMHLPNIAERYGLMLESYLRGAGTHRKELLTQVKVMDLLIGVAVGIKKIPMDKRLAAMRDMLRQVKLPKIFQLPLDPRLEVCGLRIEKCKFMNSKKVPMWLVFENAEEFGDPVTIIFKEGDDLRQDALTLQMLRIMDRLWKEQGMDLRMNCYGAISTGNEIGMIEVVLNSITMAGICKEAGGALQAFPKDTFINYFKNEKCNARPEDMSKCQDNFTLSCAAYCVATYVLGIGDRHNDNIMTTKTGQMFHIDFGHFLGNYKSKFGIKRERAPFVFTHQYMAVIGDEQSDRWKKYVRLCKAAYNTLRQNANLFINLFHIMLATGIPELQEESDIYYLRDALVLDKNDEEAAEHIEKQIEEALTSKSTKANEWIHILAKK